MTALPTVSVALRDVAEGPGCAGLLMCEAHSRGLSSVFPVSSTSWLSLRGAQGTPERWGEQNSGQARGAYHGHVGEGVGAALDCLARLLQVKGVLEVDKRAT